jgi:NAD+ kinase
VPQVIFSVYSNRVDAIELADEATRSLDAKGISSLTHFLDRGEQVEVRDDTLVVSLGGDGTFLQSARLAHTHGARVLAVNLGRLGFLLNVPSTEIVECVNDALETNLTVERLALQISVGSSESQEFAFNEVVVERAQVGHMVKVRTFIDDDAFLTYSADGVMVATPTGSTGYNFSAGGPVVDTTLSVMMLTPIAPHFTIDRSIVVDGGKVIRLLVDDMTAAVVADGRPIGSLQPGEAIEVSKSPSPVRVVAARSFDLGNRLREGLREGHA